MNGTGSMASLAALALAAAVAGLGAASQARSQAGYEIVKSQTVQTAPSGWVGRKTTDRETNTGNTPETDGNSSTFVLTIGGFVRKCPTATGIVAGNFEYSVTGDVVDTDNGETRRTHYANHFTAMLEGHVKDDAMLDYIEIEGDLTKERDGAPRVTQHVPRLRFMPGPGGTPDFDAMLHSVEVTADLSVAVAEDLAGPSFLEANLEWIKGDECVKFVFDPASDTRGLGPGASATVKNVIQTLEGSVPVSDWLWRANPIDGIGRLGTSGDEGKAEGDSFSITYTASSQPKKGNGYTIRGISKAGITYGKWTILDPELRLTFDLTATQKDKDIDTHIHLVLAETKLLIEEDGAYRGQGDLHVDGQFRGDSCSATLNFTGKVRSAARPQDPERTRFQLELTPNPPTYPSSVRCTDPDITLTMQWPITTLIHGPTVNPAVLGQATPVHAVLVVETLTATIDGTVTISLPPPE